MAATALTLLSTVSPYGAGPGNGVAEAAADTSNGNSFANDGHTHLLVRNNDTAAHSVTISGKSYAVPASVSVDLGPFPVFQQFGPTVTVTGSSTQLKLTAYSVDQRGTAKR